MQREREIQRLFPPEQQRLRGRGLWASDPKQPIVHWHQPHCQLAASVYGCARDTRTIIQWQAGKHTLTLSKSALRSMSRRKPLIPWGDDDFCYFLWFLRTECYNVYFRNSRSCTITSSWTAQFSGIFSSWFSGGLTFLALVPCFTYWASIHCWEREPMNATGGFGGFSLRTVGQRAQHVDNTARVSDTIPWQDEWAGQDND